MLFILSPLHRTFWSLAAWLALAVAGSSPGLAHAVTGIRSVPKVLPSCSWNRPGVDPFMGDVVAAVDRYADIPPDVRARLKERMAKREYDDLVSIRRDRIVGDRGQQYNPTIRDMHFGAGQVCHTVSRDAWTSSMQERGLVYCDSGHCILVPTVCRNVSRIARRGVAPEYVEAPDELFPVLPPAGAAPAVAGVPVFADALPTPVVPLAIDAPPSFSAPGAWDTGVPRAFTTAAAGGVVAPVAAGTPDTGLPETVPSTSTVPPTDSPVPVLIAAVPEPATWASLVAGLVGVALMRRRCVARRGHAPDPVRSSAWR